MKIKNIISLNRLNSLIIFLLTFSTIESIYADDYTGALYYYYFARQPSAKAEAMGRSAIANEAGAFSCLYNPALISQNNGLCLSASYSSPYYLLEDAKFIFLGATYTSKDYGSFGLCRYNFDDGLPKNLTDENGNSIGSEESTESMYTFTYSYPLLCGFNIAANLTYYYHKHPTALLVGQESNANATATAFPIDIGILKAFTIDGDENINHHFAFGTSLYNITNAKVTYDEQTDVLPQVFHFGISYQLQVNQLTALNLKQLKWLLQIEYQDVFNSRYYTGFKFGSELSVFDLLFIRVGYYNETQNDYGVTDYNKSRINDLTYGFGLAIPINTLFNFPLIEDFRFDMLVLKQPSFIKTYDDWGEYSYYNFTVNFNL